VTDIYRATPGPRGFECVCGLRLGASPLPGPVALDKILISGAWTFAGERELPGYGKTFVYRLTEYNRARAPRSPKERKPDRVKGMGGVPIGPVRSSMSPALMPLPVLIQCGCLRWNLCSEAGP
jgi:hypothetical protein